MAYANPTTGEKLYIKFGDGQTPETFSSSCSVNTQRSVEFTKNSYTGEVPNCDDPSAPNKTVRIVKSTDFKFSGAGVGDAPSVKALINMFRTRQIVNAIITQATGDANGWTLTGPVIIESIKLTGTDHENQTFDISVAQADELVWSD